MPVEPRWLTVEEILDTHADQIKHYGGLDGVRDLGLVESAITAPRNRWLYGTDDIVDLAVALWSALARNHAFIDGNKRVATVATLQFLRVNGFDVDIQDDLTLAHWLEALIRREIDEQELADRLYRHII